MAEVYVGTVKGLGGFEKLVAIKVIHPRYSEDEHFIRMLVEEAKITVLLNHVNIAQTFDLGCIDGKYYIVMELVEGADGYRVIKRAAERRRALPIDICAHVIAEVANGLDYAHRKQDSEGRPLRIVHRDISPQNIIISSSGDVKIVDFGIAKAALRSAQTEVGVIKGKYYYMSPEQAWADPMDCRSDIFSAAVVLYELLTGRMVYSEDNVVPTLLDKVRKAEIVRPERFRPSIPASLSNIVMKALAKQPEDRYESAKEFALALSGFVFEQAPAFSAARVAEMMATLFPNLGQRASAPPLRLPSVEQPLPAPGRVDLTEAMRSRSVIFSMRETDEELPPGEATSTQLDSVVVRQIRLHAKRALARGNTLPGDETEPQGRRMLSIPEPKRATSDVGGGSSDRVTLPHRRALGSTLDAITTHPIRALEVPTDDHRTTTEYWESPTHPKEEEQWESDTTVVDAQARLTRTGESGERRLGAVRIVNAPRGASPTAGRARRFDPPKMSVRPEFVGPPAPRAPKASARWGPEQILVVALAVVLLALAFSLAQLWLRRLDTEPPSSAAPGSSQ